MHRVGAHPESIRAVLALVVVIGGGGLVALLWFAPTDRDPSGLITALIAVISGVLGHYFGSRGVERAEAIAETQRELGAEATQKMAGLRRISDEYARIVEAARHDPGFAQKVKEALDETEG